MKKTGLFFAGCALAVSSTLTTAASKDTQMDNDAPRSKTTRPWMVTDHKKENMVYPLPSDSDSESESPPPNYDDGIPDDVNYPMETAITTGGANSVRYACMLNDLIRRVEVDYFFPDTNVPCQVNYYKDVENPGVRKTLWSSETFEGYCEEQAQNFLNQLVSWGWNCQAQ